MVRPSSPARPPAQHLAGASSHSAAVAPASLPADTARFCRPGAAAERRLEAARKRAQTERYLKQEREEREAREASAAKEALRAQEEARTALAEAARRGNEAEQAAEAKARRAAEAQAKQAAEVLAAEVPVAEVLAAEVLAGRAAEVRQESEAEAGSPVPSESPVSSPFRSPLLASALAAPVVADSPRGLGSPPPYAPPPPPVPRASPRASEPLGSVKDDSAEETIQKSCSVEAETAPQPPPLLPAELQQPQTRSVAASRAWALEAGGGLRRSVDTLRGSVDTRSSGCFTEGDQSLALSDSRMTGSDDSDAEEEEDVVVATSKRVAAGEVNAHQGGSAARLPPFPHRLHFLPLLLPPGLLLLSSVAPPPQQRPARRRRTVSRRCRVSCLVPCGRSAS